MNPFIRRLFVALPWLFAIAGLQAEAPAIVAKARAFLGGDAELEAIRSIRYEGTLTFTETGRKDEGGGSTQRIQILFQKPCQQRIEARTEDRVEVTALDGYEAWHQVADAADPAVSRLTLLSKDQIRRLRANTWQNLAFFLGIEREGGEIRDHGVVDLDGRTAHKLSFVHGKGIVFTRYFEPGSGRLLLTETEQGAQIREDGEIRAGGVRFPRRVVTTVSLPEGGDRVITARFDRVTINERFPPELFRVPFLASR